MEVWLVCPKNTLLLFFHWEAKPFTKGRAALPQIALRLPTNPMTAPSTVWNAPCSVLQMERWTVKVLFEGYPGDPEGGQGTQKGGF